MPYPRTVHCNNCGAGLRKRDWTCERCGADSPRTARQAKLWLFQLCFTLGIGAAGYWWIQHAVKGIVLH